MEIQTEVADWLKTVTHWKKGCKQGPQGVLPPVHSIGDIRRLLKALKLELDKCANVEEGLHKFPQVGQLLGHICSLSVILSDEVLCKVLFECVIWFFVPNPVSVIQRKSSTWAMSQIRGMTSHNKDVLLLVPLTTTGLTQVDFNSLVLEEIKKVLEAALVSKSQSKGFIPSSVLSQKKLIEWIKVCLGLPSNHWFCDILPRMLQVLIQTTGPENAETESLLSQLAKTQASPYTGEVTVDLSMDVLHFLWNNYPPSLEQEVLSLLEYLCQLPCIDDVTISSLLDFRGLAKACQESPYVDGIVLAMLKQLRSEGADFALRNALDKTEQILINQKNSLER